MGSFGRARWWSRLLYTWPTVLILIVGLGWFSRSVWRAYQRYSVANDTRQELKAEFNRTVAQRNELAAEVVFLETDRGLEERLRTSLPVAKAGEGVIVVVPATTSVAAVASTEPWWEQFLDFLQAQF